MTKVVVLIDDTASHSSEIIAEYRDVEMGEALKRFAHAVKVLEVVYEKPTEAFSQNISNTAQEVKSQLRSALPDEREQVLSDAALLIALSREGITFKEA